MKLKLIALANNINKITVKSNLPHNKELLVQLTVKEISELTPKEAKLLIRLLKVWMDEANGSAHESSINAYIARLKNEPLPDDYSFGKVYFAISTPEVNGTKKIGIESFVEFENSPKVTAVTCWENAPHNLDSDIDRWRMLDGRPETKPKKDSRHLLGVGRQLLWNAIQKEATAMTSGEFIFYIGAIEVMKEEGIEIKEVPEGFRSKPFTKAEILAKAKKGIR